MASRKTKQLSNLHDLCHCGSITLTLDNFFLSLSLSLSLSQLNIVWILSLFDGSDQAQVTVYSLKAHLTRVISHMPRVHGIMYQLAILLSIPSSSVNTPFRPLY